MSEAPARIEPLGDGALLVTFGDVLAAGLNARAHDLAASVALLRERDPRFGRAVPAYASVLVPFDPVAVDPAEATKVVESLVGAVVDLGGRAPAAVPRAGNLVEVPVHYGGPDGPDLDDVAALHGLRAEDVVAIHAGAEYRVYFLGFAPGFAYLGPLPAAIATPRLPTPRQRLAAGSVGIADAQTGVYPFALPGGWRIIGRTDVAMWDLSRDAPSLLQPGDRVRFVPIE